MAVTSTAVPSGTIATIFGNQFVYKNLRQGLAGLPKKIAILATYDPLKTSVVPDVPVQVFTEVEAGDKFGFGFPAHLAAKQVLRKSGIVPVFIFPIEEAAAAVAAAGTITVANTATSSGTISLYIAGTRIPVNITKSQTAAQIATAMVAAITANTTKLPVTAAVNGTTTTQVDITSKYLGLIANDITLAINLTESEKDLTPGATSFTIVAMASGAGTPTITAALANFGETWYTHVVNTFGPESTTMAALATFNEDDRWDTLINKPFVSFYGTIGTYSTVTTITDALKIDRTNASIPSPGAYSLPLELAALACGLIAARSQDDPAQPYTGLELDGLLPGPDSGQWTHTVADAAEKLGASWTVVRDGVITLKDIVTHYHRTGEDPPAFRYVVDIMKLMEWAYNVSLVFKGSNWEGKILVDDADIVSNPNARRPKDAIAEIFKLADGAAFAAILTRPDITKANTQASIDIANPNRINIQTLIVLSGATRVISLTTNFGFNFGSIAA